MLKPVMVWSALVCVGIPTSPALPADPKGGKTVDDVSPHRRMETVLAAFDSGEVIGRTVLKVNLGGTSPTQPFGCVAILLVDKEGNILSDAGAKWSAQMVFHDLKLQTIKWDFTFPAELFEKIDRIEVVQLQATKLGAEWSKHASLAIANAIKGGGKAASAIAALKDIEKGTEKK